MYPWLWQPASHQPRLPEGRKGRWKKRKKVAAKEEWEKRQAREMTARWARTNKKKEWCWNHCRGAENGKKRCENYQLKMLCSENTLIENDFVGIAVIVSEGEDEWLPADSRERHSFPHSPILLQKCDFRWTLVAAPSVQCQQFCGVTLTSCWEHLHLSPSL